MDPYLSKNSHHGQGKAQGLSVGHVITYDYTGFGEIYRMLKQLDQLYENISEQSATLQELHDFKDPQILKLERELLNLVNLTTTERVHQGMTHGIDELKSQIVSLNEQISGLQENKTNKFYAVAFRLHNVSAKLSEQLKREKTKLQELQGIQQNSTLQLKSLQYDINVLKEKQASLEKEIEMSTVREYTNISDDVLYTKFMQLEKKRKFLKETYDEQKSMFVKQYNLKMMSMIPLLQEAKETDSKLLEMKKIILHQQLVIGDLTMNENEGEQVYKIGQMLEIIDSKKYRAKTELQTIAKSSDSEVVKKDSKKYEFKTDMESDSRVSSLRTRIKTLPEERQTKPSKAMMRLYSKPQEIQAIKLLKIEKDSIVTIAGRLKSTESTPKHKLRKDLERNLNSDSYMSRLLIRRQTNLKRISQPELDQFELDRRKEILASQKKVQRKSTAVRYSRDRIHRAQL